MSSLSLKRFQARLNESGFPAGEPDGVWGPETDHGANAAMDQLDVLEGRLDPLLPASAPTPIPDPIQLQPSANWQTATELAYHEACIRQAYWDAAGGVWTWSVGLTSATGHDVRRYVDNPQPMRRCMEIFVWALQNYAKQVTLAFGGYPLTQQQFDGAVSYHWNTGAIAKAEWVDALIAGRETTARKLLERSRIAAAPKVLEARRKMEAALIFDGVYANDGTIVEYTRLTSKHTPVWASAVRVNVKADLLYAFAAQAEPVLDMAAQPFNVPGAPTLTSVHAA